MKYTQVPADTFKQIQLNAGVLTKGFTPSTGEVKAEDILGATSGGTNFTVTPEYTDFGEDIDNVPKNTKELKRLDSVEVKLSTTFVTMTAALARTLAGAADVDATDASKVKPRADLVDGDFTDLWWIGDYSDVNKDGTGTGAKKAGYIAVHLKNGLSTGGFQIQSGDKAKGQFQAEFTAHYSIENPDEVPYEIYVKEAA